MAFAGGRERSVKIAAQAGDPSSQAGFLDAGDKPAGRAHRAYRVRRRRANANGEELQGGKVHDSMGGFVPTAIMVGEDPENAKPTTTTRQILLAHSIPTRWKSRNPEPQVGKF